jgi:hypothetical protein
MKTVEEIYKKYRIMPILATHQLRVKAVGEMICDHFKEPIDKERVGLASAFHDMGNIIKFNLSHFPDSVEPEGLEYWEGVKREYIEKYGQDEHAATLSIAKEIGLDDKTFKILNGIGFSQLDQTLDDPSMERKICAYADMRVGPRGIISIDERLEDGRRRYAKTSHSIMSGKFDALKDALKKIEDRIFEKTDFKPEDISDETIMM